MVKDNRTSRTPVNGSNNWGSNETGTVKTLLAFSAETSVSINDRQVQYSSDATTVATLTLYDAKPDAEVQDLTSAQVIETIQLEPGDKLSASELAREDSSAGVVGVVSNNDGSVNATVGAYKVT